MFQSYAIIPAAGSSTRMGCDKLLLPWGPSTLIEQVLSAWFASRVGRVIVVVRPDDTRLRDCCHAAGAEVVIPEVPPSEMKVSVQLGLRYVQQRYSPQPTDVWLLAPADMPRLSPRVINRLLEDRGCPRGMHPRADLRRHAAGSPRAVSLVPGRRGAAACPAGFDSNVTRAISRARRGLPRTRRVGRCGYARGLPAAELPFRPPAATQVAWDSVPSLSGKTPQPTRVCRDGVPTYARAPTVTQVAWDSVPSLSGRTPQPTRVCRDGVPNLRHVRTAP